MPPIVNGKELVRGRWVPVGEQAAPVAAKKKGKGKAKPAAAPSTPSTSTPSTSGRAPSRLDSPGGGALHKWIVASFRTGMVVGFGSTEDRAWSDARREAKENAFDLDGFVAMKAPRGKVFGLSHSGGIVVAELYERASK